VFANRYFGFDSNLAENSYVGLYLQLGLAGLILLAVLLVVLLAPALRIRDGDAFTAALAVVVAGLVLGVGQSFLYSVGATGTLPFWICAFLASARAPKAA
jgi:O-antigen ligase